MEISLLEFLPLKTILQTQLGEEAAELKVGLLWDFVHLSAWLGQGPEGCSGAASHHTFHREQMHCSVHPSPAHLGTRGAELHQSETESHLCSLIPVHSVLALTQLPLPGIPRPDPGSPWLTSCPSAGTSAVQRPRREKSWSLSLSSDSPARCGMPEEPM